MVEIVNNFECTSVSMKKFQSPPAHIMGRENQVSRQRQGPARGKQPSQRTADNQSANGGDSKPCYRCLGTSHKPEACRYKDFQCRACQRHGHLEKACRQRPPAGNTSFGGGKQRYETARSSQAVRGTRYIASTSDTEPQRAAEQRAE